MEPQKWLPMSTKSIECSLLMEAAFFPDEVGLTFLESLVVILY
jgi:hypothetical protein